MSVGRRMLRSLLLLALSLGVASCGLVVLILLVLDFDAHDSAVCVPPADSIVHVPPAPFPLSLMYAPSPWRQRLRLFPVHGKPHEFLVSSSITDVPDTRHVIALRVSALGTFYETMRDSSNGAVRETLKVRLRRGDAPKTFFADYEHTVRRRGVLRLRFGGTTILTLP